MSGLPELVRRLSRAIETGRGIRLAPEDLDLVVEHGGYAALSDASAKIQRERSQARLREREAEALAEIESDPALRGVTGEARESMLRARRMLRRARR